jgi:transposase
MERKDIIRMSHKELKRLHIIHKVLCKKLKQREASRMLKVSDRQTRRIVKRVKEEGEGGIAHKSRGRRSNRAFPPKYKERVVHLYRETFPDFGPTLANEKLSEMYKIDIGTQTLRNWLIEDGAWSVKRERRKHRQWRERKQYYGEMEQIDGSHHDWFEGRGPGCVLMSYVDDAGGRVYARFYAYEGTVPALDSFKRYCRKYGIPVSVYIDKHSTYKSPRKPTIEEQLAQSRPLTQFGRALEELGVEVIYAHSPQAKGRVERLFRTFQDRVIKEMRLKGIGTIEAANTFLEEYLPRYNKRFTVMPARPGNLHRAVPKGLKLDAILCRKTERVLRNDYTVAHNSRLYQVTAKVSTRKVIVEERLNGRTYITYKGRNLAYRIISQRPVKNKTKERHKRRVMWLPPLSHPWKKQSYKRMVAASKIR